MECGAALGVQPRVGKKPVLGEKDRSKQPLPESLGMTKVASRRDKAGKVCV